MGHQAAQCTVGTVNWRNMYGAESFLLRRPVFWSEIEAALKSKKINFTELEAKAREYANSKAGLAAGSGQVPSAPVPPTGESDLPPGWATAKDAEGKVYYWHKETKAVQWNKPTLPVEDVAMAPAPVENGVAPT